MLAAAASIGGLAACAGVVLTYLAQRFASDRERLIVAIDARLPQTQCTQCGHPGCRPYAAAIADGGAIDLCPPGGEPLVRELAALLGRPVPPSNADVPRLPADDVAVIDETRCIGCALCLPVCPTDAIVGAPQWMHTVIAGECTGCALCLPPCPVDCIRIVPRAALQEAEPLPAPAAPLPCIRCGDCVGACPMGLRPDLLYRDRDAPAAALSCIECGACDAACPSGIVLRDAIVRVKRRVQAVHAVAARAERARPRNVAHEARAASDRASEASRRAARIKRRLAASGDASASRSDAG